MDWNQGASGALGCLVCVGIVSGGFGVSGACRHDGWFQVLWKQWSYGNNAPIGPREGWQWGNAHSCVLTRCQKNFDRPKGTLSY